MALRKADLLLHVAAGYVRSLHKVWDLDISLSYITAFVKGLIEHSLESRGIPVLKRFQEGL